LLAAKSLGRMAIGYEIDVDTAQQTLRMIGVV
jgi:hypothetical protein